MTTQLTPFPPTTPADLTRPVPANGEGDLIELIYSFANKEEEWFNLLLGLSKCISMMHGLPQNHPHHAFSERLSVHFRNAVQISGCMSRNGQYLASGTGALEQIGKPAGIVDRHGRVVELNQQALELFQHSPGWSLSGGRLAPSHLDLHQELLAIAGTPQRFGCLSLEAHSPDSARMHITQIPSSPPADTPLFYFCVQTLGYPVIDPADLRRAFSLTEAEALVAATIVRELSISKTATALHLKPVTVRDHLSSIYPKMGVNRKPDMIRMALQISLVNFSAHRGITNPSAKPNIKLSSIYLRDGRKLSYADHQPESTDDTQSPETVLMMHNLMGSAYEMPPEGKQALGRHNVRLIIPERPGYGDSDPHPQRTLASVARDLVELLDALGLETVKVLGYSSGGSYALAMAQMMPHRVSGLSLVASITRLTDIKRVQPLPLLLNATLQSLRYTPFVLAPMLRLAVGQDLEQFYKQQLSFIRPSSLGKTLDASLLSCETYKNYSINNFKQSLKQGVEVWAEELKIGFSDWPFDVRTIPVPCQIWHGACDDVVPLAAMEQMRGDLNVQHFNKIELETHLMLSRYFDKVIEQLISA